jgi:hypothetical protein
LSDTDLDTFLHAAPPRSRDELDSLAQGHLKKLSRVWLSPLVCLAVAVPLPLVAVVMQDSLDNLSLAFIAIWEIGAILIALWMYSINRRKEAFLNRLLADGEAGTATIVEMIHMVKNNGSSGRFFKIRAEMPGNEDHTTVAVQAPVAVAAHLEAGMKSQVLTHQDVPYTLWVFPGGFPPVMGRVEAS